MSEKEYIERGAVCKVISKEVSTQCLSYLPRKIELEGLNTVMNEVKKIPAADVVEVVHGEWISVEGDVIWKCSICDAEISTSWDYENEDMFKYCPCCGAKMDGERKEQV